MKSTLTDTIVSISTSIANGAISIIRLSGDDAINITSKIFKGDNLNKAKSHTIHYGHIIDKNEIIDEVLVSVFLPPKSYTREKVIEINCHGGIYVTNKVLELLIENGARIAEPGEFTKRAFVNGRIDLTEAEAVMDMIDANTKNSLKLAGFGLNGEVRNLINGLRKDVLEVIVSSEANIDYPEYEDTVFKKDDNIETLSKVKDRISDIIKNADSATKLKYGIKTAIIGKPNVGKSSLLNALLNEDKAIVSNIAGTTRDTVEGDLNVGGIILHLIDTAGIRETDNVIEQIGVERSQKALNEAELVILMFDNSELLSEEDINLLNETSNKTRIILVNKSDLPTKIDFNKLGDYLLISSFNKEDIDKVKKTILNKCALSDVTELDATYISSARQVALLKNSYESLNNSINLIKESREIDLITLELYAAYDALSSIVGEADNTDFVDEIFKRFCLGK